MADLNERLEHLITDQDSMKRVLELAQSILAQKDNAGTVSATSESDAAQNEPEQPDLSDVLSSLLTRPSAEIEEVSGEAGPDPSAEPTQGAAALAAILPQLMQALSGQGNLVKQERITLIRAMKPYLKASRTNSIERALRMANLTKAATNALHVLGR